MASANRHIYLSSGGVQVVLCKKKKADQFFRAIKVSSALACSFPLGFLKGWERLLKFPNPIGSS